MNEMILPHGERFQQVIPERGLLNTLVPFGFQISVFFLKNFRKSLGKITSFSLSKHHFGQDFYCHEP
jgi:hypothetical protein